MKPLKPVWESSLEFPLPAQNELHIWRASLDLPPQQIHQMITGLSPDEQARAGRFRFEKHRRRFIAAHARLREILGGYLKRHPTQLDFFPGENGKPELTSEIDQSPLRFNMSHSHDLVLYAVSSRETGIDVEHIRPFSDALKIAKGFFTESEYQYLQSVQEENRDMAFLTLWTRREAFVKFTGQGIGGLKELALSFAPPSPETQEPAPEKPVGIMCSFTPMTGYIAAAAGEGTVLRFFDPLFG